jgi:ribosomal protein S12 methylthiotransferase
VHEASPPKHDPSRSGAAAGLKLTPRHYAYLKISEGCNNRCTFCIIPHCAAISSRGRRRRAARGRAAGEGRRQGTAGHQPGHQRLRRRYQICRDSKYQGPRGAAKFYDLAKELGELGVWVRLHYVYPYPHVDDVIPLMAEGKILPYLDIPFQHASPRC